MCVRAANCKIGKTKQRSGHKWVLGKAEGRIIGHISCVCVCSRIRLAPNGAASGKVCHDVIFNPVVI